MPPLSHAHRIKDTAEHRKKGTLCEPGCAVLVCCPWTWEMSPTSGAHGLGGCRCLTALRLQVVGDPGQAEAANRCPQHLLASQKLWRTTVWTLTLRASLLSADGGLLNKHPRARQGGESNGNPFQYSCLENPMDGGAW